MRMLLAIGSVACMVIIGAAALASAGPSPGESGPAVSNSTTSMTTSTTSATNAPMYPGHSAY
ncbi:MAG: hypothetical protein QOH20_2027 [Mycobacterium sp.]|nr:hypothetical protein [Mycobacterium sp.]